MLDTEILKEKIPTYPILVQSIKQFVFGFDDWLHPLLKPIIYCLTDSTHYMKPIIYCFFFRSMGHVALSVICLIS